MCKVLTDAEHVRKNLQDYVNPNQLWNTLQLHVIPFQLFKYHSVTNQNRYSINTDKNPICSKTQYEMVPAILSHLFERITSLSNYCKKLYPSYLTGPRNTINFAITQNLRYNFCKIGSLFNFYNINIIFFHDRISTSTLVF